MPEASISPSSAPSSLSPGGSLRVNGMRNPTRVMRCGSCGAKVRRGSCESLAKQVRRRHCNAIGLQARQRFLGHALALELLVEPALLRELRPSAPVARAALEELR